MSGWDYSPYIRAGLKPDYLGEGIASGPKGRYSPSPVGKNEVPLGALLTLTCNY